MSAFISKPSFRRPGLKTICTNIDIPKFLPVKVTRLPLVFLISFGSLELGLDTYSTHHCSNPKTSAVVA